MQKTISKIVSFTGIGLHSGNNVSITLKPLSSNEGIIFKKNNKTIRALYTNVVDTKLGTTIMENGERILTVEHLMAAIWACGIDNLLIEINNDEIPIMDGSSVLFIKNILSAGIRKLDKPKKYLKIKKQLRVEDNGKFIQIKPYKSFSIDFTVNYDYGNIGEQTCSFNGNRNSFAKSISLSRTFCNEKEIESMKKNGLARGGDLNNAMVFNDNGLVNESGFRVENEVVKHKLLDCIGDIYTSGYNIIGKITSFRGGHTLNNMLLKEIFKDNSNFEII